MPCACAGRQQNQEMRLKRMEAQKKADEKRKKEAKKIRAERKLKEKEKKHRKK